MDIHIEIITQVLFWGLYTGCIYILLATGLNLIFGVMKIVNFAHGEFLMLGTYITFFLFVMSGFNPYVLLCASIPLLVVIGVIIERLCFRPILGTGKLNEIFVSIGLIYIIQNLVARIWTDEWKTIQSPFRDISVDLGVIQVPLDYLIIMAVTAILLISLYIFLITPGLAVQSELPVRIGKVRC